MSDILFNDSLNTMTLSEDGSYTAYSKEYDVHYTLLKMELSMSPLWGSGL